VALKKMNWPNEVAWNAHASPLHLHLRGWYVGGEMMHGYYMPPHSTNSSISMLHQSEDMPIINKLF